MYNSQSPHPPVPQSCPRNTTQAESRRPDCPIHGNLDENENNQGGPLCQRQPQELMGVCGQTQSPGFCGQKSKPMETRQACPYVQTGAKDYCTGYGEAQQQALPVMHADCNPQQCQQDRKPEICEFVQALGGVIAEHLEKMCQKGMNARQVMEKFREKLYTCLDLTSEPPKPESNPCAPQQNTPCTAGRGQASEEVGNAICGSPHVLRTGMLMENKTGDSCPQVPQPCTPQKPTCAPPPNQVREEEENIICGSPHALRTGMVIPRKPAETNTCAYVGENSVPFYDPTNSYSWSYSDQYAAFQRGYSEDWGNNYQCSPTDYQMNQYNSQVQTYGYNEPSYAPCYQPELRTSARAAPRLPQQRCNSAQRPVFRQPQMGSARCQSLERELEPQFPVCRGGQFPQRLGNNAAVVEPQVVRNHLRWQLQNNNGHQMHCGCHFCQGY